MPGAVGYLVYRSTDELHDLIGQFTASSVLVCCLGIRPTSPPRHDRQPELLVVTGTIAGRAEPQAHKLTAAQPTRALADQPAPEWPVSFCRPTAVVADVVYRPLETALLAAARARGCRVLHGGGMVVLQAAESLRLFTGVEPDADRMLAHFEELEGEPAHAS